MTKVEPTTNESVKSQSEEPREQHLTQTPIDHILQKLSRMELPAKEHFERYMRHKWRLNHKPKTLASSFTSVVLFLDFYGKSGKREIEEISGLTLRASSSTSRTGGCVSPRCGRGLPALSLFFIFLWSRISSVDPFLNGASG